MKKYKNELYISYQILINPILYYYKALSSSLGVHCGLPKNTGARSHHQVSRRLLLSFSLDSNECGRRASLTFTYVRWADSQQETLSSVGPTQESTAGPMILSDSTDAAHPGSTELEQPAACGALEILLGVATAKKAEPWADRTAAKAVSWGPAKPAMRPMATGSLKRRSGLTFRVAIKRRSNLARLTCWARR